jgi:hypothetical protein
VFAPVDPRVSAFVFDYLADQPGPDFFESDGGSIEFFEVNSQHAQAEVLVMANGGLEHTGIGCAHFRGPASGTKFVGNAVNVVEEEVDGALEEFIPEQRRSTPRGQAQLGSFGLAMKLNGNPVAPQHRTLIAPMQHRSVCSFGDGWGRSLCSFSG